MSAPANTRGGEATAFGLLAAKVAGHQLSRKTRLKLERGDSPRSGQPVWRNSYYEGQLEGRLWRRYGDGSKRQGRRLHALIVKAAKQAERETRQMRKQRARECRQMTAEQREHARRSKGPEVLHHARRGVLGEVGVEVLDFLWSRVDYFTGRLEPAIATIADEIGRSYSAVHEALKRLKIGGWVQSIRRSRPIEKPEPGGPLVEQIPNAYVLLIPERLRRYVALMFGALQEPDCLKWDRDQRRAEEERMLRELSAAEWQRAMFGGSHEFEASFAAIAKMIDDRESSIARETGGELHSP